MTARLIRQFAYSAAGVVILMATSAAFLVWAALVAVNDDCALDDEHHGGAAMIREVVYSAELDADGLPVGSCDHAPDSCQTCGFAYCDGSC